MQVGIASPEGRGQVATTTDMLVLMGWEMVGSLSNPHPRYDELLALVAHRKLSPAQLATREIALDEVNDTLQRAASSRERNVRCGSSRDIARKLS